MKNLLSFFLCSCLLLNATACSGGRTEESPEGKSSPHDLDRKSSGDPTASGSDSENTPGPSSDGAASGSKILVAYFSLAGEQYEVGVIEKGNTEIVAEMIAESTGADIFKIESTEEYPTAYDELLDISRKEEDDPPEIADTVDNMDGYDTIFLGYPI